jgi:ABC-2 type transport system ATP-binding protein
MIAKEDVHAEAAIVVSGVSHRYQSNLAIDNLSFTLRAGQMVGILGPNGSGKSTLFRLISTMMPLQEGDIEVFGASSRTQVFAVRSRIGVVFQSPSLDRKLTVRENLDCQSALVGLSGATRCSRVDQVMKQLSISDRANDRCENLSGGLKRRVEIAKGLLHHPRLLLLDEPSTGLDPVARLEMWNALSELNQSEGVTVVMTTHLLEEAEKCNLLLIMNRGRCVAMDSPDSLRLAAGGDVISISCLDPSSVANQLQQHFSWEPKVVGSQVRVSIDSAVQHVARHVAAISELLGGSMRSITIARPSLEDVFIEKTGDRLF